MKGVILAGGTGTRLRPLTSIINKHLLPVGKHPMIEYGILKLRAAGITEILLVIGKQSAGLYVDFIGSGKEWGVRITYKIQDDSGGISQALGLAEGFIQKGEKFIVLLGDNLFEDSLSGYLDQFQKQEHGARVFLKRVPDPERYGVPILVGDRIARIEEKPAIPLSDYCVTGIYMYDSEVFDRVRNNKPSARGEYEITDINNMYAKEGTLTFDILKGWWIDAGTFRSIYEANERMSNSEQDPS